ncbi:MAG: hypothetical protein IKH16_09755 [Selenomonadaceae bacterium]|nr:hypothetical protein [Selenomonadaceae bacterium]
MKKKAMEIVAAEAHEVLLAANAGDGFYDLKEANARLNAVSYMAETLGLLTREEIMEIKKEAKLSYGAHKS